MPFDAQLLEPVESGFDPELLEPVAAQPTETEKAAASLADTRKLIRETRTIQRDALARHPNLEANLQGLTEAMQEPVISPESATKAAAAVLSRIPVHRVPAGPSTPGSLQRGLEEFIGENVSGLSTPTTAGQILATPLAPEVMLPKFFKESVEAMPEHARQMIQGETAAEKLKGGLGLGLDALIAKGTGTGALHAHAALPEQIMNHPLSDAEIASLPSLGTKPMANLDVNPAEINVPQGVVGQPRVNPGALLRKAGVTEPIPKPPIDIPDEGVSTGGTGPTEQLAPAKPISRGLPDVGTNVQWITGEGDKPKSGQVIELRFDANTEQFAPIVRTAEGETLSLDGWMTGQVKPRTALMAKPESATEAPTEPAQATEPKAITAPTAPVPEVPPKTTEVTPSPESAGAAVAGAGKGIVEGLYGTMFDRLSQGKYPEAIKNPTGDRVLAEHQRQPFASSEEIQKWVNTGERTEPPKPVEPPKKEGELAPVTPETKITPETKSEPPPETAAEAKSGAESWADQIIKDSKKRLNLSFDPELLAAYAIKGAIVIGRGIRDFAKWSGEMLKQFGDTIKPHLKNIYDQAVKHVKNYVENSQKMGIVPPGNDVLFQAIEWFKGIPTNARGWMNQLAGKSAPRTSAASAESGNALVHYASSKLAAPLVARSMATDVLGELDHDEGRARLGAVLVEDRLRAIRLGLAKAGDPGAAQVETVIGKPWSVLKNEADFQAALADPEIQAAIERHKKTVQPMAEAAHQQARGALAGPGLNTGAFVNLKAILDTPEAERFAQGGRGNLANPLQRLSRFFRQARGTAARYEVDYRTLAQRMVEGNFEESAKRTMNEQLVKDGLAVITDPGEPRPTIGGKPAVKFSIERRGIPFGDGRARTYIQDLWVRHDLAGEYRQAINTDGQVGHAGMVAAANLLNRIQLAGPTDAVWHTANMLASIATSQGGRTLLADLGRKLPGVNLADAIGRVTMSAIKVFRDSPEIQKQLAELAQMGALRAEHAGKSEWLGRAIQFIDKAGRLVRDDLYQNLVKRKLVPDTEAARREWINQMGQYNGRLMGQFQRFFKEAGFSPFIVAGRNFNRMAMRKMILSPGVEAASPGAAAEMRAVEAFGMVGTLIAIPALINYLMTGSPAGSPGIKFGQIDTGKKDKDGKTIVIDPAQWTGVRRGLRISGAQSVIEGLRTHEGGKAIVANASKDILGGILHPWTGPAVTAASVAKTGYDTRFYKQSANPKDVGENVKAALGQLNPVAASLIKAHENDSMPVTEMGKNLIGAFGVKEQRIQTAKDQMRDLHSAWLRTNPDPKVKADYERNEQAQYPTSKYKDVDTALAKGDNKAALDAINELLKTEKKQQIWERFQKQSHGPIFQESAKNEGAFIKTLTPDQQKIYVEAKKEQTKKFEQFKAVWKAKWTP